MKTTYSYSATDKNNKVTNDVIAAESRDEAYRNLLEQGLRPIQITERGTIFRLSNFFIKRPVQRISFFRSFAALAAAGTHLSDTFDLLVEQTRAQGRRKLSDNFPWVKAQAERFMRTVEAIKREVLTGTTLHESMARRPNDFSQIESAMCQIGHEAGTMPKILASIATFLEKDRKFSKQLSDAMIYPIMVAIFAVSMVIYMIVKLIPQFAELYAGFGITLPDIMVFLVNLSNILGNPYVILMSFAAIATAIYFFAKSLETTAGALAFDRFRLRIPVIGELIEKSVVTRLCRVLSMLFDAGKSPLQAIEIVIPVTESPVFAKALTEIRELLDKAQVANLYEAMVRVNVFEPILTGFVKVGVKAGNLPEMFSKIGDYYEEDVESIIAILPTVIQTLITIVMGGVVGLIVYAVYVPLSQLVSQIH